MGLCKAGEQMLPTCLMHISYPAPCSLTSLLRSAMAPCHSFVTSSCDRCCHPGESSSSPAECWESRGDRYRQQLLGSSTRAGGHSCVCAFSRRDWRQECQSTQAVCSPAGLGPREESLQFCGLKLHSTVATWGDGIPKKGAVPCCVPLQFLKEPFTQGPLSSSLVTSPCPVQRELHWVGYSAVERHREHSMGKISFLVPGTAVLSHQQGEEKTATTLLMSQENPLCLQC